MLALDWIITANSLTKRNSLTKTKILPNVSFFPQVLAMSYHSCLICDHNSKLGYFFSSNIQHLLVELVDNL